MGSWTRVCDALPTEGRVVEIISPSGDPGMLKRSGNLWFFADGSMYVYYTPKYWRYVEPF